AQSDLTNNWVIVDGLGGGGQTPGLPNPGQNLDALRGLPVVTLTSPVSGSKFVSGVTTVNLAASASDPGGAVAKVEFFASGAKLGEDTTAPYEFAWMNPADGTYILSAVATDNQGL